MIEKNIHQIWIIFDKEEMSDLFKQSSLAFQTQNPEYNYKLWQENDIDDFLKTEYPQYVDFYNNLRFKIQKVDFLRLLIIYHYGGFYFDLDVIPRRPLRELQLDNDYLLYNFKNLPLKSKWEWKPEPLVIPNDIIGCNSKNNDFFNLLLYCMEEYNNKSKMPVYDNRKCRFVIHTFGPYAYTRFAKKNKLKAISGITKTPYVEDCDINFFFDNYNTNTWFSMNKQHRQVKVI